MPALIRAFIQARMSSDRFPGKVLAPLRGQPLVRHVVDGVQRALSGAVETVVLTSVEPSDDPLAAYLEHLGIRVFRGPLEDVFARFRLCLALYPCDHFLRLCADSPCVNHNVIRAVTAQTVAGEYDLVTTTLPRSFAGGQNAELVRAESFLAIDRGLLTRDDCEHLTAFYYRHPSRFRIRNIGSGHVGLNGSSVAVDTMEDLDRLEQLPEDEVRFLTEERHRDLVAGVLQEEPAC